MNPSKKVNVELGSQESCQESKVRVIENRRIAVLFIPVGQKNNRRMKGEFVNTRGCVYMFVLVEEKQHFESPGICSRTHFSNHEGANESGKEASIAKVNSVAEGSVRGFTGSPRGGGRDRGGGSSSSWGGGGGGCSSGLGGSSSSSRASGSCGRGRGSGSRRERATRRNAGGGRIKAASVR